LTVLSGWSPRAGTDAVSWLTVYVCLLLFIPSHLVIGPLNSAGAPSMLFGLGSLCLWMLARAGVAAPTPMEPHPLRTAIALFAFAVGTSFAVAMAKPINSDEVSPANVALLSLASWFGTFLVASDGIMTRRRLDILVWRVALCGGAIGLLGIIQVLTRRYWVDRLSIPGLKRTTTTILAERGSFPRPPGTATHPIEYGVLVAMLLPIALHVGFYATGRHKVLRWLPAVFLAAVLPLTSSRSAYLCAAIVAMVLLMGWPARRRLLMGTIGLCGIGAMLVVTPHLLGSIIELFSGASNDPSIQSRTGSYQMAGQFLSRNPWFGHGLGTFLTKYRIFDNQYLNLLVSVGIVGTVLFVGIAVVAVVHLLKTRARAEDPRTKDLALSLLAGILAGFVSLAFFDAFAFPMTMGTIFLLLGIAGCLGTLTRHSSARRHTPIGRSNRVSSSARVDGS
jgi:O-antigen ligase